MNKLPKEALIQIIDYTGSCQNIGQCRLVCKQWSELAEPLMFTKQIILNNERTAVALLGHLFRKPANGKHIKSLRFEDRCFDTTILAEIVRLTFTPNMEYMTGATINHMFYEKLIEIGGAEPERFSKLKTLPDPVFHSNTYAKSLLAFRNTLEYVAFSFNGGQVNLEFLKEFKSLRKLKLDGIIIDLLDAEYLLNSCTSLEEIVMDMQLVGFIVTQTEIEEWNSAHTRVVESVRKLSIIRESRSDLLEYLIFKYPNISTFEMNVKIPLLLARNNLKRMLDVIKKINTFKVSFTIKEAHLPDCLKDLITSGIHFTIKDAYEGFLIEMNST